MKNIEARNSIYDALEGDLACNKNIGGKGGQELTVADKFLVNQEVDKYIDLYKEQLGNYPNLDFAPEIAFFASRLQQYGFEVPIADFVQREDTKFCECVMEKVKKKREKSK